VRISATVAADNNLFAAMANIERQDKLDLEEGEN